MRIATTNTDVRVAAMDELDGARLTVLRAIL